MSNKRFFFVNVVEFAYEKRRDFCFFFIVETEMDGTYSYKISDYYPTNIKKKPSIKLIQLLSFYNWFISGYLVSPDFIFNKFCSYFMVKRIKTTYIIREVTL